MKWFSEIREGMGISWAAVRAHKLRSGLATLGIVIGIVTVTLMGTAIQGLNQAFVRSISALGTDVLYVQRFAWFSGYEEWIKAQKRQPISLDQVTALERQLTLARAVAPFTDTRRSVKYRNRGAENVTIIGTTDQFLYTGGISVSEGRFLSTAEVEGVRPACVIGSEVADKLFPYDRAIGKALKIGERSFEVIGVLEKQGNFLGAFSLDNQVIIPLRQFLNLFQREPDVQIQIKALNVQELEDLKEEVRGLMRKIRRVAPGDPDDFAINQQDAFLATFKRLGGTLATVGLFITGLSLFVGGIGIMNIMFVSVAERTKEIGIRKAIGAKRRAILLQFLIEAAMICLFGGTLAVLIAFPITILISKVLPATLSIPIVLTALLVSLFTGVISGFLPAYRAARMNPVEALRNE